MAAPRERIPELVIAHDELADADYAQCVLDAARALSVKGPAAGIHLLFATSLAD